MSKFKVGDRVRYVPELIPYGEVIRLNGTEVWVKFDDFLPAWQGQDEDIVEAEDLELVERKDSLAEIRRLDAADAQAKAQAMAFVEFRQETVEWIQALEETVRGARLKADAADAQAKAQAMGIAEYERRWNARLNGLHALIVDTNARMILQERRIEELEKEFYALNEVATEAREGMAENRQQISALRDMTRDHVKPLESHVEELARRLAALEGGGS